MADTRTSRSAARSRRPGGWRKWLPLLGPLAAAAAVALMLRKPVAEPKPTVVAEPPQWQEVELAGLEPGAEIAGWVAEQGAFRVVSADGGAALEQGPEPMTEGVFRSWTRFNYGGIRARMSGEPHRRAPPRFSVGLEGRRPFHLRASPAHNRLELVTPPEVMLATFDWTWDKQSPVWLELVCKPRAEGGALLEGRVWPEGGQRAEEAQIQHVETAAPGRLSPSVRGGPFALKPILTDHISVLKLD
jgi:hypothetical protein